MASSFPTIVVIDDDPQMLIALQRLLQSRGFNVMTFSSGQQYLDLISGKKPDCLLVDVEMPGLSGIEAVSTLNQLGHQLPVVFMTADVADPLRPQVEREGAQLLCKPFSAELLLGALKSSLHAEEGQWADCFAKTTTTPR